MGPTQAAGLVVQEQAKAEATRVAALRARGIAADPRPAMEMAEAQQVIAFLMTDGVTGAMAFVENDLNVADRTPGVPRVGRQLSRACADARNLHWFMIGVGVAAGITLGISGGVIAGVALSEAAMFGFGASWTIHTNLVGMFREYFC
jgi:hypothetical protein